MKIVYNQWACQGHGRCFELAPELFKLDDEGFAILLIAGELPSELEDKARQVAQRCPEYAIELDGK
ncbi:MAG: ferredoxin [Actinomycetota bacterium]|nr:ferredoxin [Actinomycetota bacterium]